MAKPSWNSVELTPGELAERSGVAISALHFYEREGLIASRRTSGNQRRYPRETLRRVAFIRVSQRVGIPLAKIRDALGTLPEGRAPTRSDWAALSGQWRTDLDLRIEQLVRLRDELTGCIGCGCLSLDRCALANPKDALGDEGAGPRRLLVEDESASPVLATPEPVEDRGGGAARQPGERDLAAGRRHAVPPGPAYGRPPPPPWHRRWSGSHGVELRHSHPGRAAGDLSGDGPDDRVERHDGAETAPGGCSARPESCERLLVRAPAAL